MNHLMQQIVYAADTGKTEDSSIDSGLEKLFSVMGGPGADLSSVMKTINLAIDILINSAGIVALFMVFYATILYVTSYGEDAKIETAKKTLIWAVIGLVVVAGAKVLIYFVSTKVLNANDDLINIK